MIDKQKQGYPLYVKGNTKLFDFINLKLTTVISLPKQLPISVSFSPKSKQITLLLQPIINLQIIDDVLRQQIVKGSILHILPQLIQSRLKNICTLVLQYSQKSLLKNYETLLDQVPRNIRQNVLKLIIWEQGKAENSIDYQKYRINESLSQFAKLQIEQKLTSLTTQIRQHQSQQSTPKSLLHIFLLKNKLAKLYSFLQVNDFTGDLLCDIWNQIMINFRCLMKLSPSYKASLPQKLQFPEDIPKAPYTFPNTNDILGYFQNSQSTAYLRIVSHAFLNYYIFIISQSKILDGMSKLKVFLDYVLNNVIVPTRRSEWTEEQSKQFDIARNLWVVQIVKKCIKQLKLIYYEQKVAQLFKQNEELSKIYVSICSMLRNSVQRIGYILYNFDSYSIFPTQVVKQLQFISTKLQNIKEPWKKAKHSIQSINDQDNIQKTNSTRSIRMKRQTVQISIPQIGPNQIKLRQLISDNIKPNSHICRILNSFQTYSQVYLLVLKQMYQSLKISTYIRVSKSLKITLQRATIMLGDWENFQNFSDQTEQFRGIWSNFQSVQKLYKLFFLFIKYLSGQTESNNLLKSQLVSVLTDKNLLDEKQTVFKVTNSIYEVISNETKPLNLNQILNFELSQLGTIKLVIKQPNQSSCTEKILKKFNKIYMIVDQIMLNQGVKRYQLNNVSIMSFSKCPQCPQWFSSCKIQCINKKQVFVLITGTIELEHKNEQNLFYISQFQFQKTQQKLNIMTVSLSLSKNAKSVLYKINAPKLMKSPSYKQNNLIFSQIWTPFQFQISHFINQTTLCNINAFLRQDHTEKQQWQASQNQNLRNNQNINIQIAKECCIRVAQHGISTKHSIKQNKFYKLNQPINIKVQRQQHYSQQEIKKYQITIFAKNIPNLNQKNRGSRVKKLSQCTNKTIGIQVVLRSSIRHKQYKIECFTKSLIISPLLSIQYHAVQICEEFIITNINQIELQVQQVSSGQQKKEKHIYKLAKNEELSLLNRQILVSPRLYPSMKINLSFNDWFNSEHLLEAKNNTFKICYTVLHEYCCYKPIQIQSQIIGSINIPELQQNKDAGYELVGKIQGSIKHIISKQSSNSDKKETELQTITKPINLWLVPIRPGNLVLPEIWINGKRGIWINSLITDIKCL